MGRYSFIMLAGVFLLALTATSAQAQYEINLLPNPDFQGDAGSKVGDVSGTVSDQWRGFAVNGGQVEISTVPVAADELYPGSPATTAVRLEVAVFGGDQGFDHEGHRMHLVPDYPYHAAFYIKSANNDGSDQALNFGFPLFDENGYLNRGPGGQGNLTATNNWTKVTAPEFTDPDAIEAFIAFRLQNDGGENAIFIAQPKVIGPADAFMPPDTNALAQRETWMESDKLVGTSYFYWYRWPNHGFWNDAEHTDDALTNHFIDPESVSMLSQDWHKGEAEDMLDAGIDMLWPVYWGHPGNFYYPSPTTYVTGLYPLQDALDGLQAEGRTPPKVGMFYDTSTLRNDIGQPGSIDGKVDLTTSAGKDFFYRTIRSFFCNVHPRHWACVDGRPILVLYTSGHAADYDETTFDFLDNQFAAEFNGLTPYIIRDVSWQVPTDSSYRWGAAHNEPYIYDIAAVGPGFDDSAVPDRFGSTRLREDGDYYRWSWLQVLPSGVNMVHVETWNEMFEATEICESWEYGRQYIDLTAHYVSHFKAGTIPDETVQLEHPDPVLRGPDMTEGLEYDGADEVTIRAENGAMIEEGIDYNLGADGGLTVVEHNGRTFLRTDPGYDHRYAYFDLLDPFYFDQHRRVEVQITYLDEGTDPFQLQYDSYDTSAVQEGSYTNTDLITREDTGNVRYRSLILENARFRGRQNYGSDFRYHVIGDPLYISKITVRILPLFSPKLQITSLVPAPATACSSLPAIYVYFTEEPLSSSINTDTFTLIRSGGDPYFGNYTDEEIQATNIYTNGQTAVFDLTGQSFPEDTYQVTLHARGPDPILDLNGQVLDGRFTGSLPSGDDTGGTDFVATFDIDYARPDFDRDGHVDANDRDYLQACSTGPNVPQSDPLCDDTDLDDDGDVDQSDFAVLQRCWSGPTQMTTPGCGD